MMKSRKSFKLSAFAFGLLAFCGMAFTSCQDAPENSGNDFKSNLPESKGQNEVSGRTAEIGSGTEIRFNEDGTALLAEKSASGLGNVYNSARESTSSGDVSNPLSYFVYSFDSETKTVHLQLKERVKDGKNYSSTAYQDFLRTQIENAEKKIIEEIEKKSELDFTVPGKTESAKEIAVNKAKSCIEAQKKLFENYIDTLYSSAIDYTYEISGEKLSLTMNKTSDVKNVYACFSDGNITVNDRKLLCPFTVKSSDGKLYAGIPEYNISEGKINGETSVILYPILSTYDFATGKMSESNLDETVKFLISGISESEAKNITMTFSVESQSSENFKIKITRVPDGINLSATEFSLSQNDYFTDIENFI